MAAAVIEQIFIYVGWIFTAALALGTLAIMFTDLLSKLTNEQRIVFAVASPSVGGYVIATRFFGFNEPMGVLGVMGILYLIVPLVFFYVQLKRIKE